MVARCNSTERDRHWAGRWIAFAIALGLHLVGWSILASVVGDPDPRAVLVVAGFTVAAVLTLVGVRGDVFAELVIGSVFFGSGVCAVALLVVAAWVG